MKSHAVAAALFIVLLGGVAEASPTPGQDTGEIRMVEFDPARPPLGYIQFCRQYRDDCRLEVAGPRRLTLTKSRMQELIDVNNLVNRSVAPATDQELYGVAELWTYPADRGDCEDYVLLKRRVLLDRGWPASVLLITVVRDQKGDGHAVLTVPTSAGDLILDNQDPRIRVWRDTPYEYLKRQSSADPNAWVSLRGEDSRPSIAVGGTEHR